MIHRIRSISAAALAFAALSVHAQTADTDPSTRWRFGMQLGTVRDHGETEPVAQVSLGYALDRTWSMEALANVSLLFIRVGGREPGQHEFDSAVGGRVLATLPLDDRFSVVGGLGVVAFEDEIGNGPFVETTHRRTTSPLVSLAANWRLGRRWSLGVEASSFTEQHTFNLGLRSDFHF